MKKIKLWMSFLAAMFFTNLIIAQTLEDGKKFMYYERYKSAKEVFQKLLTANPNNEEAAYWMGQALLSPDDRTAKDLADAKTLYQANLLQIQTVL